MLKLQKGRQCYILRHYLGLRHVESFGCFSCWLVSKACPRLVWFMLCILHVQPVGQGARGPLQNLIHACIHNPPHGCTDFTEGHFKRTGWYAFQTFNPELCETSSSQCSDHRIWNCVFTQIASESKVRTFVPEQNCVRYFAGTTTL